MKEEISQLIMHPLSSPTYDVHQELQPPTRSWPDLIDAPLPQSLEHAVATPR